MYNYQCIVVPSIKEKFAVDELTRHNFGNRGRPMKSEEDETLEDNTIFESYEWRNWNDAQTLL